MKLYSARHGQTDTNANGISNPSNDEPLNELGIQQATQLAKELKGVKLDAIISSPLKRAYQTAELVNEHHQLPIKVDEMFRELTVGSYVDMSVWNDMFDFDKNIQIGNNESLTAFFERIYAAIDNLKQEYGDKTVLVVSHGGVQHALYAYANNLPWSGNMRVSPTKNCEYRIYDL